MISTKVKTGKKIHSWWIFEHRVILTLYHDNMMTHEMIGNQSHCKHKIIIRDDEITMKS